MLKPVHCVALVALTSLAVGCAHSYEGPRRPDLSAPRAEREQFYADHQIREAPAAKCLRWCGSACTIGCLDAFLPSMLIPTIVLGNGERVHSPRKIGSVIQGTEAGEALEVYEAAREAPVWLVVGAGGMFMVALATGVIGMSTVDAGSESLVMFGAFGIALVGIGAAAAGVVASWVVAYFAEQSFYELYNPSLHHALGLDRSPPPEVAPQPSSPATTDAAHRAAPAALAQRQPRRARQCSLVARMAF